MPGGKDDRFSNSFEHSGEYRTAKWVVNIDDAWVARQIEFRGVHVKHLHLAATMGRSNAVEIRLARLAKFLRKIDPNYRFERITRGFDQHPSLAATEVHKTVFVEIQFQITKNGSDVLRFARNVGIRVNQMFGTG